MLLVLQPEVPWKAASVSSILNSSSEASGNVELEVCRCLRLVWHVLQLSSVLLLLPLLRPWLLPWLLSLLLLVLLVMLLLFLC